MEYICDSCGKRHYEDRDFMYCEYRWYRFKKVPIREGEDPKSLCKGFVQKRRG